MNIGQTGNRVPAYNSCTNCSVSPEIIHDHTPNCHTVSWVQVPGLTIERSLDSQVTCAIDILFFLTILSMGIFISTHWQTSGRLVQESNVCMYLNRIFLRKIYLKTLHCYHNIFNSVILCTADVRLTGALIECLYCIRLTLTWMRS